MVQPISQSIVANTPSVYRTTPSFYDTGHRRWATLMLMSVGNKINTLLPLGWGGTAKSSQKKASGFRWISDEPLPASEFTIDDAEPLRNVSQRFARSNASKGAANNTMSIVKRRPYIRFVKKTDIGTSHECGSCANVSMMKNLQSKR